MLAVHKAAGPRRGYSKAVHRAYRRMGGIPVTDRKQSHRKRLAAILTSVYRKVSAAKPSHLGLFNVAVDVDVRHGSHVSGTFRMRNNA